MAKRKERPVEAFTTGLALTVVFGVLLGVNHGAWFWIFPLVFAGVLPMIRGVIGLVSRRATALEDGKEGTGPAAIPESSQAQAEKEILLAAKASGGRVTPAIVALKTSLSLDKADEILQDLARRGHATMLVSEDGRVEYHFPELGRLPGPGSE